VVTFFLWLSVFTIIYLADPNESVFVIVFFILFFLANLFTFSIIFSGSLRGFLTATAVTVFLIFCYFGIGNILNAFLITAIAVTIEIYFFRR